MSDEKQPEALRLQVLQFCEAQMKELKDEISRLHAENAALQAGYDAARLEIEYLKGKLE